MIKNLLLMLFRIFFCTAFKLTINGQRLLNASGPLILAPNHSSWLDAVILATVLNSEWKFIASADVTERNWVLRLLIRKQGCVLVDPSTPFSLREVSRLLKNGGKVVIFPEGGLSDTGRLQKFYEGVGFLMARTQAPVATCYIRGANLSVFARNEGKKRLFPAISLHIHKPEHAPEFPGVKLFEQRQRITKWLRERMVREQFEVDFANSEKNLLAAIRNEAKRNPSKKIIQDASGANLTYRKLVTGARLLSLAIKEKISPQENTVLVLLPNANAMPLTLMALWQQGRTAAILNFSSGLPSMLFCAELTMAKTLITSRTFLSRASISIEPFIHAKLNILYLEDLRQQISSYARISEYFRQVVWPSHSEDLPESQIEGDTNAVVLFTSGSEGKPKGVILTHSNIVANVRQIMPTIDFLPNDKVFNALPMFHSFGLLGAMIPLCTGMSLFVYPSPLHYRVIPSIVYDRKATIFLGTNTFLNGYARRANPYDFHTLRYVIVGAEKLQQPVIDKYTEIFGARLLEAYGATECSPLISINSPFDPEPRSVGKIVPGMEWKLEPVAGVTEGGRLFLRGPNIMRGYINPEANAQFQSLNGWYDTGDIVTVSDTGMIRISGRMKRFAKISGEMISLTAVEELLNARIAQTFPHIEIVVMAIPDKDKGEALLALSNEATLTLDMLRKAVSESGQPLLWAPKHFRHLSHIPKLGSGKTDYVALQGTLETMHK